jgi:hypothetical protein
VIAKIFHTHQNFTTVYEFQNFHHENLSELLFPDKTKTLNNSPIYVALGVPYISKERKFFNKWEFFIEIVKEKLNASLAFNFIVSKEQAPMKVMFHMQEVSIKLHEIGKLDFLLNNLYDDHETLQCYNSVELCFLAPLPPKYSIYELILVLPFDKLCWMYLGVTIAISAIAWRIIENHWNFIFGIFAFFVGQSAEIRT